MSSAGHVSDMNSRLKNNRDQIKERKARHNKVLDAYRQHPKYQSLSDERKLSPEEYNKFTSGLRQKAKTERSKYWIAFVVIILIMGTIIGLLLI